MQIASDRLPLNMVLWGFTDFHGDEDSKSLSLSRSFSEYRLSHEGLGQLLNVEGLGVQAEFNTLTGSGNDVVRIGMTYRHGLNLPWGNSQNLSGWLQWRAFPYESDNDGGQASVIFYLPFTPAIHLKGFADYNVAEMGGNRWVIEPELNIRVAEDIWALLEMRLNGYERAAPGIRGSSVAVGIRYHFSR